MEPEAVISPSSPVASVALVVGVTGMAGLSLAQALRSPTALGGHWKVYGAARRPMPSWFPFSAVDHYINFDAADLNDTRRHLSPISADVTHLFWVALQVRDSEESNTAVNRSMLSNVLHVLGSAPDARLRHVTLQTGTKHYMGPIFDPTHSASLAHVPPDPPFREDSPRLPFPNFYYALEDLLASHAPRLTYSVHRASIILGASSRSAYNTLLTLAVYAAVCRLEGLPFRFPGTRYTWEHFCDATDVRVLAEQHVWAAVTEEAKNQAFNCTNGDVFTWKSMWKVLSEVFGVGYVPYEEGEEFDIVGLMEGKGKVWDAIVEEHGLYPTRLEEITCFGALKHVLHFEFQHVSSMNKSRDFGFFGHADSLKSIGPWVETLRQMKIIP
ncbi:3-oxo-Delta(4,5)-steroid 5-beta-reductase-like [Malania oleifera]|uniref:3-oxo-Delta(4,5)-steroid 5-beta-reductase-like n=1 Tax=Malania oleifera TaxID=397392 RepID=UPI0025AE3895|nr:3-oxo-Delta(4,5)-steroid 5-beta-reductase-like [Malania oleifera]